MIAFLQFVSKPYLSFMCSQEIVKHFLEGVISVLVLSNLVDEVLEIEASLIISLDPCKTLLKTSDARFFKGTAECLFILTNGVESRVRRPSLRCITYRKSNAMSLFSIEISRDVE